MTNPTANMPKSSRGPMLWVLGCVGVAMLLSCFGGIALLVLGALVAEPGEPGAPTVSSSGAPVAGDAVPAPVGEVGPRQTVTTADLVGDWGTSSRSSTTYVDRSSGAYAGSESSAFGEWFTLRADSTYTSKFTWIDNGRVSKEQAEGTWTLSGSKLLMTESGGNRRGWWFLGFEQHANGESTLSVLGDQYEQVTEGSLMYRDTWVRAPR